MGGVWRGSQHRTLDHNQSISRQTANGTTRQRPRSSLMKLLRLFVVRHQPTHINKCCSCCTHTQTHTHAQYIHVVGIVRLDWLKPIRRIDLGRMFSVDTSHMSHGQFRAHTYADACKSACVCVLCIAQAVKTVCQAETAKFSVIKEQTGRRKTHIKQKFFEQMLRTAEITKIYLKTLNEYLKYIQNILLSIWNIFPAYSLVN